MARSRNKLTARAVAALSKPGKYSDGGGLYLQVTAAGAKSWVLRYQLAGRRRDMGLGSATVFSFAEARDKARTTRKLVAEGIDPIERKRVQAASVALATTKTMTFQQSAEA